MDAKDILGRIILIVDGAEKAIPLGVATINAVKGVLAAIRTPGTDTDGQLTEAEVLEQIEAAREPWKRIQERAEQPTGE